MEVDRCVKLHNEILRESWTTNGRNHEQFGCLRTWTEFYDHRAREIRPDLNTDLYAFLSGALVADDLHFFYWVDNLSIPEELFYSNELVMDFGSDFSDDEPDPKRYVVLYLMRDSVSHRMGLMYAI